MEKRLLMFLAALFLCVGGGNGAIHCLRYRLGRER